MVRAARFHGAGKPLKLEEVEKPTLGDNDVLLKVRAAGICHSDIHVIDGVIAVNTPLTLGHEIAGEVDEVGAGVKHVKEGDRMLVHFLSPCGVCDYCLEGNGMTCESLFMRPSYGFNVDGGYAESCRVAAERLVPLRDVPFDFGATLGCAGITAYHAVKSIANVELADTVAIYGTGGVGMYALQIAKLGGAKVIAIGRSQDKLDMAQRLGADYVVNASSSKIRDEVKKITSGKGPDIVLDFVVSDESMKNSASFLANGGKVVLVGVSNKPISFNPQIFVLKEFTIAGSLVGNKNELAELVGLAESGRLKSVVTKKFSLDEINGAIDNLRNGQILGRGYFAIS